MPFRPGRAEAEVDTGAIAANVARLIADLAPGAQLCAVVKAHGYGHGATAAAQAALAGGAQWLAVATAGEAHALRAAGIHARVLVMGALCGPELEIALGADADVVAWDEGFVHRLAALGAGRVHVKLDSGMGRLGTRDPEEAARVADAVRGHPELELAGLMTHFATADDRDDPFMFEQLERFLAFTEPERERDPQLVRHAANSAATLRDPVTHLELVRCGVAVYGLDPFGEGPRQQDLAPALTLRSYVAAVKDIAPGQSAGYGRAFVAQHPTRLAVLPIGYGDGYRRGLSDNADVLIGGRRRPVRGTVSMDNITVEVADDVCVGAPAVLIGRQGEGEITAEELAARLNTINYEITCGLSSRVVRAYT
jgi:alanine racemase